MRCEELQPLQEAYLDSELDAWPTLEIEQHLASCPECRRRFDEEQKLEAGLWASLNRGQKTAALWERIERSVVATVPAPRRPKPALGAPRPAEGPGLLAVLGEQLQVGLNRSRSAWSGLAAAWVVILALNFAAREPEPPLAGQRRLPPASEVRLAVRQKQILMAELAFSSESTPADKPKAVPPSPRSDRRSEALNA